LNNHNHEYGVVVENRNSVMLNKKAKVMDASPICPPNHYEEKPPILFVENMKLTNSDF
jgi:hypothetical protein